MAQETTLQHSNPRGAESAVRRRLDDFLGTLDPEELAELRASHDPSELGALEDVVVIEKIVGESAAAIAIARVVDEESPAALLVTGNLEKTAGYIFPKNSPEQNVELLAAASRGMGVPEAEVEQAVRDMRVANASQHAEIVKLREAHNTELKAAEQLLKDSPEQIELLAQYFGGLPGFDRIINDARVAQLKEARRQQQAEESREQYIARARQAAAAVYPVESPAPVVDTLEESVQAPSAPDSPPLGTRLGKFIGRIPFWSNKDVTTEPLPTEPMPVATQEHL